VNEANTAAAAAAAAAAAVHVPLVQGYIQNFLSMWKAADTVEKAANFACFVR
jgi:hypothetical protein